MQKPLVITVVGPTAIGKTKYSINLAKQIGGEVISADSRQVYKGLDIGSGKVTKREMRGVPHYMLDVVSPKTVFSTHRYKKLAMPILKNILARGKVPIIVGGTGFYVDTLLGNVSLPNVPPNKELRKKLEKMTLPALIKQLEKIDPARAKTIDQQNKVRLVRAIEIAKALGKVPETIKEDLPFRVIWVGLESDREIIREKIIKRVRSRIMKGMLEEVEQLHRDGVSWNRLYDLGLEYRYCALFIQEKLPPKEFEKILTEKIYQYAMRQLRWFRRNKEINWVQVE